jgi:hypothetical protein
MVLTKNWLQPINGNSINLSNRFVNPLLKLHELDIQFEKTEKYKNSG